MSDEPRRRGRPRKNPVTTDGPDKEARLEAKKEERNDRRRRRKVGQDFRGKLGLAQADMEKLCPEYELRWVNDVSGRVSDKYDEDWDYVSRTELSRAPGDDSITEGGLGDRVSKVVGTGEGGSPMRAYLMKKRREFYEEDKTEKEKAIDEREAGIFRGTHDVDDADSMYLHRDTRVPKRI